MGRVLIQMAMLSYGRTQAWNASGGGDGDHIPFGEPPLFDEWARRYVEAGRSDEQRVRVIADASRALEQWRGGMSRGSGVQQVMSDAELLRNRILTEGKGWSAVEVARACRCTVTHVRKVRLAAGVDENGDAIPAISEGDTADQIRQWAQRNLSHRQIAMLTGTSARTVGRVLKANPSDNGVS